MRSVSTFALVALVAACLLLSGCSAGLANRATADDYTAALAAEAAAISLAEVATPAKPAAPVITAVLKDTSLGIVPAAKSSGSLCGCGETCTCAAELVKLRAYRDQAEAFFKAHGYRDASGAMPTTAITTMGSCTSGSCSTSGYGRPARRGWLFGRRR